MPGFQWCNKYGSGLNKLFSTTSTCEDLNKLCYSTLNMNMSFTKFLNERTNKTAVAFNWGWL